MADGAPRMIFLGFGKYARADRIYALEPLAEGERGHGAADPGLGGRDRRADRRLAHRAGDRRGDGRQPAAEASRLLDGALDLAQRVADAAEQGRFDVGDLGRRARRLLGSTTERDGPGKPVLTRSARAAVPRRTRPGPAPHRPATSSPGRPRGRAAG